MSIWGIREPRQIHAHLGRRPAMGGGGAAVCTVAGLVWGFLTPEDYKQGIDGQDPVPACAGGADGDQYLADDAGHPLIWLIRRHHVSALAAWRRRRWRGDDADRADHRRDLGPADVGNVVGMGPAA